MDKDYNHLGNTTDNHRKAVRTKLDRANAHLLWIQINVAIAVPLLFAILIVLAIILRRLS